MRSNDSALKYSIQSQYTRSSRSLVLRKLLGLLAYRLKDFWNLPYGLLNVNGTVGQVDGRTDRETALLRNAAL